ncbi:MAG: hypothetical protein Q8R90_12425 [Bacteroidales bacterium]|jgi:hypothetical protein|nr:hypothetical protein [Bacteroidales bacterium]MDZ4059064.1 hypothetical protein [Bacteroidales bacterium]
MEAFFTFVLLLILFFWLLGRFAPLLLAWWIRRRFKGMVNENQNYSKRGEEFREGDVIVEVEREEKKVVDNSVGEYVDFEETK